MVFLNILFLDPYVSSMSSDCDFDLDFHSGSEEDAPLLVKDLDGEAEFGEDEEGQGGSTGTGELKLGRGLSSTDGDGRTGDSTVEETRRGSTGNPCGDRKGSTCEDERSGGSTATSIVPDERREGYTGTDEDVTPQDGETFAAVNEPCKDDKRLDLANVGVSLQDYLRERVPLETKKSTDQAVRLYERVMASAANKQGKEFKSLRDTPLEDLPEALGQFIIIARKQNGDVFNASSLETYYQSLARYLSTEYEPKVDIKNDVKFKIVQQTLDRRCTEVAAQGGRPGKNASKPVSAETVQLAYKKGTLGRKNPRALVTSVHSIMMPGFGLRSKRAYLSGLSFQRDNQHPEICLASNL